MVLIVELCAVLEVRCYGQMCIESGTFVAINGYKCTSRGLTGLQIGIARNIRECGRMSAIERERERNNTYFISLASFYKTKVVCFTDDVFR